MTTGAALPPTAGAQRTPPALGFCFDRGFPAGLVTEFARRLEADGAQQLWVAEDCFYSAGVPLAGVSGPKSLAMAGQVADGLVMADGTGPLAVRAALAGAGAAGGFHVAKFARLCVASDRATAYRTMAPYLAGLLDPPAPQLRLIPFYRDLAAWYAAHGTDGLAAMPAGRWHEIGPIGTLDDARAHLDALAAAGVSSIALVPALSVATARAQLGDVAALLT